MKLTELAEVYSAIIMVDFLRYFIPAVGLFLILRAGERVWRHKKLQATHASAKQPRREFIYSMSTVIIFSLHGLAIFLFKRAGFTAIYTDFSQYGWVYFFASIAMLIVLHDAYFYWTHRLMHTKPLYGAFHKVHHLSVAPTPLAAYAFAPLEAMVEAGFFLIAVFLVPAHPVALTVFLLWMIVRNVLGHSGFEFWPKWFITSPLTRWITTTTHHDMHHKYFRYSRNRERPGP
ncbi:MAG: sterol desaturase family protein [Spirochaetia bacterium]|nr:sterol desaturase family protein [Spirochaetia bacterium]